MNPAYYNLKQNEKGGIIFPEKFVFETVKQQARKIKSFRLLGSQSFPLKRRVRKKNLLMYDKGEHIFAKLLSYQLRAAKHSAQFVSAPPLNIYRFYTYGVPSILYNVSSQFYCEGFVKFQVQIILHHLKCKKIHIGKAEEKDCTK